MDTVLCIIDTMLPTQVQVSTAKAQTENSVFVNRYNVIKYKERIARIVIDE